MRFSPPPERRAALDLYDRIVAQARSSVFFARLGVPDTLDGRFESIALHGFLIMNRLKGGGKSAQTLSQALFDRMFADIDRGLRETGVGDMSVGRHVRRMAEGFLGRVRAYDEGLADEGDAALQAAVRRNLFGTVEPPADCVAALVAYIRRQADYLASQPLASFLVGRISFCAPIEAEGSPDSQRPRPQGPADPDPMGGLKP